MNYLYTTIMYINVLWTQMSRQWMYMADRRSKEFIDGVHEFIEAAEKHKYGGFVRCPCKFCKNEKDYCWRSLSTPFIPCLSLIMA